MCVCAYVNRCITEYTHRTSIHMVRMLYMLYVLYAGEDSARPVPTATTAKISPRAHAHTHAHTHSSRGSDHLSWSLVRCTRIIFGIHIRGCAHVHCFSRIWRCTVAGLVLHRTRNSIASCARVCVMMKTKHEEKNIIRTLRRQ